MLVFNFLILTIVICCESKSVSLDNPKSAGNIATTSNVNFVEEIKQDLKRNNDDYKEMIQRNVILNNKKRNITGKEKESKNRPLPIQTNQKGYRRKYGGSSREYEYEDTIQIATDFELTFKSTSNITPITKNVPQRISIQRNHSRFDKRHNLILPLPNRIPNIHQTIKNFTHTSSIKSFNFQSNFQPPSEIPKFIKDNKIGKFKMFMKKNQGLFKQFISSKQAALTPTPLKEMSTNKLKLLKPTPSLKPKKKVQRIGDKNDGELPSPELLDMAPAIGGRLHKRRQKGKLCHRHVLMPEGPKYDSKGRWYVPAHELVAKHPYPATRLPVILLPRCCNCCKKSVLGCE